MAIWQDLVAEGFHRPIRKSTLDETVFRDALLAPLDTSARRGGPPSVAALPGVEGVALLPGSFEDALKHELRQRLTAH